MNIPAIKMRIDTLKELFSEPNQHPIGCKELIIYKYSQSVLNQLERIIDTQKTLQDVRCALQAFLSNNWEFVKGNLLCYTALPRHEITEFLADIAAWIAVSTPQHGVSLPAINILMPTIRCDSLNLKRYPNLDEIDLKKVIQTHILAVNHHYLVPLSLFKEIVENKNKPNAKINNPYYDVFIQEKNSVLSKVFISDKDIKRLYAHSDSTKAIGDAICHYQLSINQASLLKQLQTLIHGLEYNSVRGAGREESAATGGYNALIAFMDFWQLLSDQLALVPQALIKEINFIKQLTTDPEQNTKCSIKTCLASRRDELCKQIAGHEKILNTITISNEKKHNLIQENIQQLKNVIQNLVSQLQNGSYVGRDRFGITTKLLIKLKIPLNLVDYETVAFILKEMEPEEIPAFCALEEAREKMAKIFGNLDDFILLSDLVNNNLFALFLQALRQEFQSQVRSNKNLMLILQHFNPNHYMAIYEALKEKLASIIKNAHQFSEILKNLSSRRKTAVYQVFKEFFALLIKNTEDFLTLYLSLEPNQQTDLCHVLKKHWHSIVQTNLEFWEIFSHLSAEQKIILYEIFEDQLPLIIKDTQDFLNVYSALAPIQQITLCIALKKHWLCIVKTAANFSKLLRYLSPMQKLALYDAFKAQLPALIKTKNNFLNIYSGLESNQQIALCHSLKEHWHFIIKTAYEFTEIIFYLSSEQKIILYDAFKAQLPSLVKHSKDFRILLHYLDYPQRISLCCALKEHWPLIINSNSDLCELFRYLTFEKCRAERLFLCNSLKELPWSSLINDARDLNRLLACLQPTEQILVFASLQTRWDCIVKNPDDFNQAIAALATDERIILCASLQAYWPTVIKNPKDFKQVFYSLEFYQRPAFCESFKMHWPLIIKTTGHLYLLHHLVLTEQKRVCASLATHWPTLIKNINDFLCVDSYLDADLFASLCDALKDHWPCLIKSQQDLKIVFCSIDTLKKEILLTSLKKHLPMAKNLQRAGQATHLATAKSSGSRFFSRIFKAPKANHFDQRFHPAPHP
ncbi:MAG: hypothetical protein RLZZ225_582 [Pseudomonadota bacterium]